MKNPIFPLLVALAVGLIACNQATKEQDKTATPTTDTSLTSNTGAELDTNKLDTTVVSFFENAALGGMVEVESSAKIEKLTSYPEIKVFAAMMLKDHGEANKKLEKLAMQKGYALPKALPASKLALINKLDDFKNEGRNEYYVRLMINEHANAINLFSMGERSRDQDIAQFSAATLPIIKQHYQHILKLDTLMQKPRANQGDDPLKISDRKKQ